ncbi:MAG: hypothetical protein IRZ33_00430 [Alicyclobacillaceae bacterium]|nr:hypothetical protein [Alicyclobacillaceae bacterium]
MRRAAALWTSAAAAGFALTACGTGGGGQTAPTKVPANAVHVHVTASNFQWTMDRTTLKTGVPVDFIVQSSESTHGFRLIGSNISVTVSAGQPPVHVVWTPPKPGQYTIQCDVFCGSGHANMFKTFTVQ